MVRSDQGTLRSIRLYHRYRVGRRLWSILRHEDRLYLEIALDRACKLVRIACARIHTLIINQPVIHLVVRSGLY